MQKPHSSTGNALAIIQHSKLLSPQDRLLLQEGCEQFTNWREIFSQDIYPDLHTIFEVLEPLIKLFEESARKGTLPEYGQAVNVVLRGVYKKFHAWRCFQGWGEQSVELYRNPLLLLPLVQTDAAIRKCDCIGTISRFTRRGVLSLVEWRTLFEELSRFGHSHTLCFINSTDNTSKYVKREIHLSCMGFTDNYVDIESRIIKRYQHPFSWETNHTRGKNRVSLHDTILLVSGLLDDTISYSRRVRGEIASSQSFIKNMLSKIKL